MTFSKIFLSLSLLLSSLQLVVGDLSFIDGGASGASLQQYGAAQATVSLLLTTKSSEKILEHSIAFADKTEAERIVTEHEVTTTQISSTAYNVSVLLTFEAWVGDVDYTVSVGTMEDDTGLHHSYAAEGKHSVYGMVLYETDSSGKKTIVSGDNAPAVHFKSYEAALGPVRELKVVAHGPGETKLSDTSVHVRSLVGDAESKLLSASGVTFGADGVLFVAPNPYRVGSGNALVTLEHAGIAVGGESCETQFVVEMGSEPRPPPVVSTSGEVEAVRSTTEEDEVSFALAMFNMEGVSSISATVGGTTFLGEVSSADEEVVTFTGPGGVEAGTYALEVDATRDGGEVAAVVLEEVRVVFSERAGASGGGGSLSGRTVAGVASGVAGMVIVGLACVAGLVAWRSRRAAAAAEKSFSSATGGAASWADGELPAGMNIQRDVYGRGSVTADGSEVDVRTADSEFWRVV